MLSLGLVVEVKLAALGEQHKLAEVAVLVGSKPPSGFNR
jgi:hypothetical protein